MYFQVLDETNRRTSRRARMEDPKRGPTIINIENIHGAQVR